jgi:hypothetical protein
MLVGSKVRTSGPCDACGDDVAVIGADVSLTCCGCQRHRGYLSPLDSIGVAATTTKPSAIIQLRSKNSALSARDKPPVIPPATRAAPKEGPYYDKHITSIKRDL